MLAKNDGQFVHMILHLSQGKWQQKLVAVSAICRNRSPSRTFRCSDIYSQKMALI